MEVMVSRGKEADARGTVRFIGQTLFAVGIWIGVELVDDVGKNNGTVQGQFYFHCPPGRGLFVRDENVEPLHAEAKTTFTSPGPSSPQRLSASNGWTATELERRVEATGMLKLKLSQLMSLLNQQLEIVKELEEDAAAPGGGSPVATQALYGEILELTEQEAELVDSFQRRLRSAL